MEKIVLKIIDTNTTTKPMSKHKNACYVRGTPI
jgi:hypothetical protein